MNLFDLLFCFCSIEQLLIIMSIILRANELNTIIYKYLLESGLTHTAYTLFNQAALAQPLQEFRFDIRPSHLLSLLQKALIYAQIESHVTLSEYMQCGEPFGLLRAHTCKVVERAKKEKQQLMKELGEQINDSIKRTNSAYNAAIANRDYDDILYEAKGAKYFEKFVKIRIPADSEHPDKFQVKGSAQAPLLRNRQDFQLDLLKYDSLNDEVLMDQIFPCVSQGKLQSPLDFASTGEYLVQLYSGGRLTIFKVGNDILEPTELLLGGEGETVTQGELLLNSHLPQLLGIVAGDEFWVINLNFMRLVRHGRGAFNWREYDQYFIILPDCIQLHCLSTEEPLLTIPSQNHWKELSFNAQRNLFSLFSPEQRIIHIYTLQSADPLFIFDFSSSPTQTIKETLWVSSNNVDYFCWLTETQIKVFDISLNSYSRIIDISEYDPAVSTIKTLKKSDRDECFLVGLGAENLLVYDITNAKIERVQVTGKTELFGLGRGSEMLALLMENCIYFLVGQLIEPIFK